MASTTTVHHFGTASNIGDVEEITIVNGHKTRVSLLSYGAIIRSFFVLDNQGRERDIVLGYDTLDGKFTPLKWPKI
jgi:galactose mutarotase-like enzyme